MTNNIIKTFHNLRILIFAMFFMNIFTTMSTQAQFDSFETIRLGEPVIEPIDGTPAESKPMPNKFVRYPLTDELIGPSSEYSETTRPGHVRIYSYPKFYRNATGNLTEVITNLVSSSDPEWDYEVVTGIWILRVDTDGMFQAEHQGDTFTYRLQGLGIGRGNGFRPVDLGETDFSNYQVSGDSIRWSEVFPDIDLSLRYIHDIMKVDVIVKREFMDDIRAELNTGSLKPDEYLTARFEIPNVLVTSQTWQGDQPRDLYEAPIDVDTHPLVFEKDGRIAHQLRPVQTYVVDEQGEPIDSELNNSIGTAQRWQLRQGGTGFAEMSANIGDLAKAPEGDVVIDPSMNFGFYSGATKDARLAYHTIYDLGGETNITMNANDHAVIACDFNDPSYNPLGTNKAVTGVKLYIYVDGNTSTSNVALKAYNITTNWSEATVGWYDPWTTDGGDYTTVSSGNASTIPAGQVGWYSIDLTAPFKARYPASITEFLNKGFLLKYSTAPSSGANIRFRSKEYLPLTPNYRWYIEVTYAVLTNVTISDAGPYTPDRLYVPRSRTITATIDPPVSGVQVGFRVKDTDDLATNTGIDGSSSGNDNYLDKYKLNGQLNNGDDLETQFTYITTQSGVAQISFSAETKYGGNNYQIEANLSGGSMFSPEMVVWRKLKVEYDAMEKTPLGYTEYAPSEYHLIHQNYFNQFIGSFQDVSDNYNRCIFITPEITTSQLNLPFKEYMQGSLSSYHNSHWNDTGALHLISAHLYQGPPNEYGEGGISDGNKYFYIFWEKSQYEGQLVGVDVDAGESDKFWIMTHEIGHNLGRVPASENPTYGQTGEPDYNCQNNNHDGEQHRHHWYHGLDDVNGLPGTDCVMTQDYCTTGGALNPNGQVTKRFGPACVLKIRRASSYYAL